MSNLIHTYPVFESSQVLTSSQLNQLVSYLDQQNRLTRVKLIGMGIVCGLELTYDDSGSDPEVIISEGTAITSEGFLITLGSCTTTYYRPYQLPEGVEYKPFGDPVQDVTLYELLREEPEDTTDVKTLDDPSDFLDDKFVLLFLECFDNDLKSCLGNVCDELGIDRIFTVRKLLIGKDDLDLLLTRSANVGELYPDKFDLPDIVLPRALFDPDDTASQNYTDFSETYAGSFKDDVYPALFGDDENEGALSDTYTTYELLLGPVYDFTNPFETIDSLKSTWADFFEGTSSPGPIYRGIQYFHDFLKDLILAYDEFRESAFELMSECCPDMSLFPRHVMLGRALVPDETPEEAGKYRHGFTQPPIFNHQKYLIEKTISLHKRLVLMVTNFNLERVNNPTIEADVPVRITPSFEKATPLSRRALPYYFDMNEEEGIVGEGTLEQFWNFDETRKKLPGAEPLVYGYENQVGDQSAIGTPFETPLYFDLDNYPFMRIEGHIGYEFEDVVDALDTLKSGFNLPFDTVALQLDPDADLLELDYSCGFEDLQEEYAVARASYCGFVTDLIEIFQFVEDNLDSIFDGEDVPEEELEKVKEILGELETLCELLADCLDEFDFVAFQATYKTVLERLLDFILIDLGLLNEINVDADDAEEQLPLINGLIQRVSPVFFRFVDLLFYNTFLRLYHAFKRREYYLQRETAVFSSYIRRHPGVEHQAGVPKGGTFILVYDSSEDPAVIADFNLPYRCCGTDRCVPMCENNGDGFVFEVPPFARPDYAITVRGNSVEINVAFNDFGFWSSGFKIGPEEGTSEQGGSFVLVSEDGLFEYKPPSEEFTGFDTFQYVIANEETGVEDVGTVTVLVKEPEAAETGCYSTGILNCWGMEAVKETLAARGVDPSDMTESQMLETLLASLQQSAGFTLKEIRTGILVDETLRRQLLNCLEIFNDDNTSYDQLEQLIIDYQNERCGAQEGLCTVTEVSGTVIDSTGQGLPGVNLVIEGTTVGTVTNADGRFFLGIEQTGQPQTLVATLPGFDIARTTVCNEPEIQIVLQKSASSGTEVVVNPELIESPELVTVLGGRDLSVADTGDKELIIAELEASEKGTTFSEEELRLLKNDTLRNQLDDKGITYTSSDTKDSLIRKLLSG